MAYLKSGRRKTGGETGEDPKEEDQTEPLEEVGPGRSEATAELCELKPHDVGSEKVQESEVLTRDEIAEQFPVEAIPMIPHLVDGLPFPGNEGVAFALAAPFTIDHVVCLEDDREWVEVFAEDALECANYEAVHGPIDARLREELVLRSRYDENGDERKPMRLPESEHRETRFGHQVISVHPEASAPSLASAPVAKLSKLEQIGPLEWLVLLASVILCGWGAFVELFSIGTLTLLGAATGWFALTLGGTLAVLSVLDAVRGLTRRQGAVAGFTIVALGTMAMLLALAARLPGTWMLLLPWLTMTVMGTLGALMVLDISRVKQAQPPTDERFVLLHPRRDRCQNYKRQCFSNDEQTDETQPGHRILFRNCTERRSVGGAFMSLRDEAVYACDYRDPPDPRSTERFLDGPDRVHVRSHAHRRMVPMFGLEGETTMRGPTAAEQRDEDQPRTGV
jgi:hypothetical protein